MGPVSTVGGSASKPASRNSAWRSTWAVSPSTDVTFSSWMSSVPDWSPNDRLTWSSQSASSTRSPTLWATFPG